MSMVGQPPRERILSVDALRGFDMFWITGGNEVVASALRAKWDPMPEWLEYHFHHIRWEGFSAWDLIMPLFLFIVGVAMPFSFGKRQLEGQSLGAIYRKIARRFILLFILGMAAQGNLLACDLSKLHVYCNTLQAIACGYVIAAVALLHLSARGQALLCGGLMLAYWALMMLVPVSGHGAGVLEEKVNLAMYLDEQLLGRFRDGTTYTWILSSLTFGSTTLLGVLGGHVLKSGKTQKQKVSWLVMAGLGCLAAGWAWGLVFPVIKHLWTSSMVLWAGGWCYLLLAFFYYAIDVKGYKKWAFPFTILGMNAIFVYMAVEIIRFRPIGDAFVGGLASHAGVFEPLIHALGAFGVLWLLAYYLYRKGTFIRV